MVKRDDILAGLHTLGIVPGDVLHVHSSLSSFGQVERGSAAVIDALMAAVTDAGTLLMPSYGDFDGGEYGKVQSGPRGGVIFDIRSSPSRMGKITDDFWRMPGVRRSIHPTHCTAGWGKLAAEMLAGHENCIYSCGRGTPLWKMIDHRGKILLLGVDHRVNTFIHTMEDTSSAPTTSRNRFEPAVLDSAGRTVIVPTEPHLPGLVRRFQRGDELAHACGAQRKTAIGQATVRVIDVARFAQAAHEALARDPMYFIDTQHYRGR